MSLKSFETSYWMAVPSLEDVSKCLPFLEKWTQRTVSVWSGKVQTGVAVWKSQRMTVLSEESVATMRGAHEETLTDQIQFECPFNVRSRVVSSAFQTIAVLSSDAVRRYLSSDVRQHELIQLSCPLNVSSLSPVFMLHLMAVLSSEHV
jgi:hypothetical protein